jgi:hypothetical protein
MSQQNVEIVRRFNEPTEGDSLVPAIREGVEQLGPDPTPEAALAWWGEPSGWRYSDLRDWVLTLTRIPAHGRDGTTVGMEIFQIWRVRDGKIAVPRAFLTEPQALEAAGLSE